MENNYSKNVDNGIPEEIKGWNWGAFFLNGFWGVANKTYFALLAFIPFINIPIMIFLGYKGNEISWKNAEWESIEHFQEVQSKWNIAGIVVFVIYCIAVILEFWNTF